MIALLRAAAIGQIDVDVAELHERCKSRSRCSTTLLFGIR